MKIILPGGSGQVGTVLARAFHGEGHDVVLRRSRQRYDPMADRSVADHPIPSPVTQFVP